MWIDGTFDDDYKYSIEEIAPMLQAIASGLEIAYEQYKKGKRDKNSLIDDFENAEAWCRSMANELRKIKE